MAATGDLGYGGIGNSVAIKFDYFDNAGEGGPIRQALFDRMVRDPLCVPAIDLTGTGVNISSGDVMTVAMNYDGSTLNVTISDTQTGESASQSYSVNIPSIVGSQTAFVGFTGGTGGLTSIPAILNWTYTPEREDFDQPRQLVQNPSTTSSPPRPAGIMPRRRAARPPTTAWL